MSEDLINILVCPVCKSALKYVKANNELICSNCGVKSAINDGIPILLPLNH
ncbi:Trm112 family protein [Candidatus Woesearchaeota archaeon]|nr:Trm112 family protein [Candidatus Woesearchaeota archaeon]MBT5272400.1 Trm112 family protein [Candidatus Woesearchaeota archaeon]MBT6041265.1 Trm112 family protein [Candidatus Woesearchaeota archaeon]MBT6336672.1 Trm112 family protein [Candidatus Woesearchaeota archaeon]MBT7927562.1 Trm112 family protein [Candidatus Woesearchaeota archaeon]